MRWRADPLGRFRSPKNISAGAVFYYITVGLLMCDYQGRAITERELNARNCHGLG